MAVISNHTCSSTVYVFKSETVPVFSWRGAQQLFEKGASNGTEIIRFYVEWIQPIYSWWCVIDQNITDIWRLIQIIHIYIYIYSKCTTGVNIHNTIYPTLYLTKLAIISEAPQDNDGRIVQGNEGRAPSPDAKLSPRSPWEVSRVWWRISPQINQHMSPDKGTVLRGKIWNLENMAIFRIYLSFHGG